MFKTILVPLDGSPLAETALPHAIAMAKTFGARLRLLRAAEADTLPGVDPTEAQVTVVGEAESYLRNVIERLAANGFRRVDTSVWYGSPVTAILEAARLREADLIVMTTHGRSGLGRLVMGSVAEAVVRGTTTPILLIRAPEAPVETPARGEARRWPAS